jgi:hypothetical protein
MGCAHYLSTQIDRQMKSILIFLFISFCSGTSWCQSDSTKLGIPKMIHINTTGILQSYESINSGFLDNTFIVLSLVSPDMFDKWNYDSLKSNYSKKSVLIIVARQDSATKTKFVMSFYKNWVASGSKQKAYNQAIEEMGPNAEIKHALILNEK